VLETAAAKLWKSYAVIYDARKFPAEVALLEYHPESIWHKVAESHKAYDSSVQDGILMKTRFGKSECRIEENLPCFTDATAFDKWNVWNKLFRIVKSTCENLTIYP
jgi:hypothetical protein